MLPALCSIDDVPLEVAMYEAYHRFLNDLCAPYPDRLTSLILVSGRDIDASVAEMQRCGKEDWPVGILPICPPDMSLDDPAWEPIWANFTDQVGDTWGDYVAMLDDNAAYLGRLGQRVDDVSELLAYEYRQAAGLSPAPWPA